MIKLSIIVNVFGSSEGFGQRVYQNGTFPINKLNEKITSDEKKSRASALVFNAIFV